MTMTMPYATWVQTRRCRDKKVFRNEERARIHADKSADQYGESRDAWAAYPCDNHRKPPRWHIGHKDGSRRG